MIRSADWNLDVFLSPAQEPEIRLRRQQFSVRKLSGLV
jgi:hypothetical protein